MNDNQALAEKPIPLKISTPNSATDKSSAAFRGATSAFSPTTPASTIRLTPNTPNITTGARHAAVAAGINPHGPAPAKPAQRVAQSSVDAQPAPARGRPSNPTSELTRGLARSTTSSGTAAPLPKPPVLHRSASTIAAQFAASRSNSPQRSSAPSPQRHIQRSNQEGTGGHDVKKIGDKLSGLVASVSVPASTGDKSPMSVQMRILDFENLPALPPVTADSKIRQRGGIKRQNSDAGILRAQVDHRRQIAQSDNRDRLRSPSSSSPARTPLIRDTSNASTTSNVSITSRSDQPIQKEARRAPPIPVRRVPRAQHTSPKSLSPDHRVGMTVNSLADAMIGASLASSRAASPVKRPTPSASRRRSRSFSALQDLVASYEIDKPRPLSRPPRPRKPPRPMKHTLRKPSASDDEEPELVKRGRKHWVRKHPNMHHEGDRKRWRDKVTEAERRRYEGVFAANRGLYIGPGYFTPSPSALSDLTAQGNRVVNVVVRDIWERSRLPRDILMEIYDLVCPEEEQSLGKDQFVAGMWLIDQRLKGRKLPVKVSASVWASIRHPDGIKLRG